ncbi:MAG: hypothetical protein ACD_63C00181G0001 [uncultured bacterium]|nr:MAG: hypothetical protein ACD_63C00181G0001 [uncultured bacterium]
MKILLVEKFLQEGGKSGGTTRAALEIRKILTKKGHEVIPFTAWNKDIKQKSPDWIEKYKKYFVKYEDFSKFGFNPSTIRKALKMIYNKEAAEKIEDLIKGEKPDLAYIHNIFHHIGPSILPILKKHDIPVIYSLHSYKHISANYYLLHKSKIYEKDKGGKYYRYIFDRSIKNSAFAGLHEMVEMTIHHKIWKPFYKYVDLYTAPSKFLIKKSYEYKYPRKIEHLPNMLDGADFQPNSSKKGNYILYFGRVSGEKGIHLVIEALSRLENPDVEFYIAGQGDYESKLRALAKQKKVENRVKFLGFKTGNELKRLVSRALFVVLPSICYENAPYAIYESAALGTPVIASHIGGIPELICEDHDIAKSSGLTFEAGDVNDLEDKISFLLENKEVLPKMGKVARKFFEDNFTLEEFYKKLKKLVWDKLDLRL